MRSSRDQALEFARNKGIDPAALGLEPEATGQPSSLEKSPSQRAAGRTPKRNPQSELTDFARQAPSFQGREDSAAQLAARCRQLRPCTSIPRGCRIAIVADAVPMIRRQAFQFVLRLTGDQERTMRQYAGSCRYVWNRALADQINRLNNDDRIRSYAQIAGELVDWKRDPETAWLALSPAQTLQQTLKDLDRAIRDGLNKTSAKRFPLFNKKFRRDSFRYPQGVKLDEVSARLYLPKIGWVRYRKSRAVLGTIKNVTVSRRGHKWRVSIQTERNVANGPHPSASSVGIDMGIARFATPLEGQPIEPRNQYRSLEKRLARAQLSMANKNDPPVANKNDPPVKVS